MLTEKFYNEIKHFRRRIAVLNAEKADELQALDEYEGSKYYSRKAAEIKEKFTDERKSLQKHAAEELDKVLDEMTANAKKIKPPAPTAEMTDALTLLKMKENPTWGEVREVAKLCMTNPLAFSVVAEIAAKCNIPLPVNPPTVGGDILEHIDSLRDFARTTLSLETVNDRAGHYGRGLAWMNGGSVNGGKYEYDPDGIMKARVDRDFADARELAVFCGVPAGKFADFSAKVDGEIN